MDLRELLDQIETHIRQGRLGDARKIIRGIQSKSVRRSFRLRLAQLSRRAGLSITAVRILNPVVRPKRLLLEPASDSEKGEYAAALIDAGAVSEGLELLKNLDERKDPKILLFRAFGMFTQWDYSSAVPLLENYIRVCGDDYQKVVGQVNLAAALVTLNHVSVAEPLLSTLLEQTKKQGHLRLHGNCLELLAQMHFAENRFSKAKNYLQEASESLKRAGSLDEFFVKKWSAFLDIAKRPLTSRDKRVLAAVKATALRRNHWEGARDCDLFLAKKLNDEALLTHLYFSTPHAGFKERVRKSFPAPPAEYVWNLKTPFKRPHSYFDLSSGRDSRVDVSLKVGQLLHRMLEVFASDFYQKFRVPVLYASLYPNEYYDPETSPLRVHQVIDRLRKWFLANNVPLEVSEDRGFYWLTAQGQYGIRKAQAGRRASPLEVKLRELTRSARETKFGTVELANSTGRPLRSIQRLVEQGVKEGLLEQTGDTWNRAYAWKKRAS